MWKRQNNREGDMAMQKEKNKTKKATLMAWKLKEGTQEAKNEELGKKMKGTLP